MHNRSSISLCKLLTRHTFGRSPKPKAPIFSRTLTTVPTQFSNSNKKFKLYDPSTPNSPTRTMNFQNIRKYSVNKDSEIDSINLKFAEAREEIESAMDSKETVYFNEEAECARSAVSEVLEMYQGLLSKLPDNEKAAVQRAMGLKIEQLKAELDQLNE